MRTPSNRFLRALWIDPGFQGRLLGIALASVGITLVASLFQSWRLIWSIRKVAETAQLSPQNALYGFLDSQWNAMVTQLILGGGASVLICGALMLYVSHRMAGPIYRLRRTLTDIADTGQVSEFNFRKGDFIEDLGPLLKRAFEQAAKPGEGKGAQDEAA